MGLFKEAKKEQAFLRLALVGPSGCGKTYTALALAAGLGNRCAAIDTERGSASLYAGASGFKFSQLCLDTFEPKRYMEAIEAAEKEGFDVLVIDSLSHAWFGEGGVLDKVDQLKSGSRSGSSFDAWRVATPMQNRLVDAILQYRGHVICTMRAKTKYIHDTTEAANGSKKTEIRKVGLEAIQRDGIEYEFTMVADMEAMGPGHVVARISKSRCPLIPPGSALENPGRREAEILRAWLVDGDAPALPPSRVDLIKQLGRHGINEVAGYCQAVNRPHPDDLDVGQLQKLAAYLDSPDGSAAFNRYLAAARRRQQLNNGTPDSTPSPSAAHPSNGGGGVTPSTTTAPAGNGSGAAVNDIKARIALRKEIGDLIMSFDTEAMAEFGEICEMAGAAKSSWQASDLRALQSIAEALRPTAAPAGAA